MSGDQAVGALLLAVLVGYWVGTWVHRPTRGGTS